MVALFRRYPILIALAALAALLALVIAWEISAHVGSGFALSERPVRRAAPFEAKLLPPPAPVQAEQQYPEFAARPLWTPTRRPAPAAAAPSTYTPGQFVLQGVIVAGDTRTAMLREKSSGKLHRVEAGKQLNGITVAEITPESVTLTQGADREVVPLQVQKGPNAPAMAATPGVPVPPAQFGPPPNSGVPAMQPAPAQVHPTPLHESGPFGPAGATHVPVPTPAGQPGGPVPANGAAPQPNPFQAGAPSGAMTAEELLARRRARRGQQSE
jgi:hypothetical protein